MFLKDINFIKKQFNGKADLSGRPSWEHASDVANYLKSKAEKNNEIDKKTLKILYQASLGHDLLEDTDTTVQVIKNFWDEKTLKYIKELTNYQGDNDFSKYLVKLKKSAEETLLVKLADIFSNVNFSVENKNLDLKWAKVFWLPLLKKYKKELFSRKFKKYPNVADEIIKDIEEKIILLEKKIKE